MRSLAAPYISALEAGAIVPVQLLRIDWRNGASHCLNTSNYTIVYDGRGWLGAWGLGSISAVRDAPGDVQGLQMELAGAQASQIALALDDADIVQGSPVYLYTALLDRSSHALVDAALEWRGQMDTLTIADDGGRVVIRATAESAAVNLLRGTPLTYTHADQQALHSDDMAFEHVVEQAGKPVVWPAKEWFLR